MRSGGKDGGGWQGGGRFGTEPLWLAQRQNSDRVRDLAAFASTILKVFISKLFFPGTINAWAVLCGGWLAASQFN